MSIKRFAAIVLTAAMCLTTFVGCGANNDEVIAKLGDKEVSYGVANFLCKYQKALYDDYYTAYYGDEVWQMDFYGTGVTLESDVKNLVMNTLHDLYTVEAHMDDFKVSITDEEKANIDKAVQAFIKANSKEALKEMSATEEILTEVLTLYTIQAKMYDAIVADVDTVVEDKDANMRGYSYISVGIEGYYDTSGGSYQYVKYTEKEIENIKTNMELVENSLKNATLEKVAEGNKYQVYKDAYLAAGDENLDKDLLKALQELKEGETSEMIVTEKAIYFARIDSDIDKKATEEKRQSIIDERQYKEFDKVLTEWQKNDGWSVDQDVLAKIEFRHILTQDDGSTEKETEKSTEKVTESTESTESTETTETTTESK